MDGGRGVVSGILEIGIFKSINSGKRKKRRCGTLEKVNVISFIHS